MSYPQPPVTAPPPAAVPPGRGRPAAVTTAVALLWTMAVAGLAYAVGMVAIAPATTSRFRDATTGSEIAENFIAVIWLDAAVAVVVAIILLGLFAVLGVGLRRGSRIARGVTLGVCVVGVLAGLATLAALAGQRSGESMRGSLGEALGAAYPNGWIGLNVAVAVAQVAGYLLVAVLLLAAGREFFGGVKVPRNGYPAYGYPPPSPAQWAVPQSSSSLPHGNLAPSEGDQRPHRGAEDEFWSRPSE